jgi:hypothetical protein
LFYLIFVHLFTLSRQASYRLPFAIDRLIDMIHPKRLRLTTVKRHQTFEHLVDLVGEVGLGICGGSAEVQGSVNVYLYSMQAFALAIVVHYTASRSARQLY